MILHVLRTAFVLLSVSVTALYIVTYQRDLMEMGGKNVTFWEVASMLGVAAGVSCAVIAIDMFTRRKKLSALSGVFLGLLAGLLAAYALSFVVDFIILLRAPESGEEHEAFVKLMEGVKVLIGFITCYLAISLVLQTKDDFRFVIPYVEFAKQIRGNRPTLLDTSVIIDGRVLDIADTQILQGTLLVPKFVLNELQTVADSPDKLRRARGRRGLEVLQKLQANKMVDVAIEESDAEGGTVDQKLVSLAQQMQARIMTNDYNLNKIATLRGVDVININDLAKAMRPVVLPGEVMTVKILKPGEGDSQGVGYLDYGTMIVVENARNLIGQEIDLVVTSMLQTSAGRMIFGKSASDASQDSRGPDSSGETAALRSREPFPGPAGDSADRPSPRNPRRRTR